MIIEFFGLSNSGKSILKKMLYEQYSVIKYEDLNTLKKFFLLLKHLFLHPVNTTALFFKLNSNWCSENLSLVKKFKVSKMRNSYLAGVLAKSEILKSKNENIIVDEFSLQSIFMILQRNSNEEQVKAILERLPKSDYIVLFEGNKKLRYQKYKLKHPFKAGFLLPGSFIDFSYGKKWIKNMEHNFEIINRILKKYCLEEKNKFKDIIKTMGKINKETLKKNKSNEKLRLPKIYKRKDNSLF